MEIEEALGFVGHDHKLYLEKENAIWSFIHPIIKDENIHTRSYTIRKDRKKLIALLVELDKCVQGDE